MHRLLSPAPHLHQEAKLEGVSLLLVLCSSQLYGGIGCALFSCIITPWLYVYVCACVIYILLNGMDVCVPYHSLSHTHPHTPSHQARPHHLYHNPNRLLCLSFQCLCLLLLLVFGERLWRPPPPLLGRVASSRCGYYMSFIIQYTFILIYPTHPFTHSRPSYPHAPPGTITTSSSTNLFLDALTHEAREQHARAQLQGGSAGDASAGLGFRLVAALLGWFMMQPPQPTTLTQGASEGVVEGGQGPPWGTVVGSPRPGEGVVVEGGGEGPAGKNKGFLRSLYSYLTTTDGGHGGGATPQQQQQQPPAASLASGMGRLSLSSTPSTEQPTHRPHASSSSASVGASSSSVLAAAAAIGGKGKKGKGPFPLVPVAQRLSERSAMLLLLLTYNHRGRGECNPFREAVGGLSDARYGA